MHFGSATPPSGTEEGTTTRQLIFCRVAIAATWGARTVVTQSVLTRSLTSPASCTKLDVTMLVAPTWKNAWRESRPGRGLRRRTASGCEGSLVVSSRANFYEPWRTLRWRTRPLATSVARLPTYRTRHGYVWRWRGRGCGDNYLNWSRRPPQVEKYRPKSLDDVIAHKDIIDTSAWGSLYQSDSLRLR